MATYLASDGDILDAVCQEFYGRQAGVVEAMLEANPGLTELGPLLPVGLRIELPDLPAESRESGAVGSGMEMQPDFSITVDGRQDATSAIRDRLVAVSVTDEEGPDSAEVRPDDRDGPLEPPRKGSDLEISLGYRSGRLTKTGRYTVDEICLEGPPYTLVI